MKKAIDQINTVQLGLAVQEIEVVLHIHSNLSYPDLWDAGTSLNRAPNSTWGQYAFFYNQVIFLTTIQAIIIGTIL